MTQTSKHTPSPWAYFSDHIWHDDDCLAHVLAPHGQGTAEGNAALMIAAPKMYDALIYIAEMLSGLKPDFLRNIGLDVALEESLAALRVAESDATRRS
jgi:hypothetical protein